MSKFDDVIAKATADLEAMGQKVDADLLQKVAKGLGPSIYNADSSKVAASDKAELARVRANFLVKKLGLADSDELDTAMTEVAKEFGSRHKLRVAFYYLLTKKFGKEAIYG